VSALSTVGRWERVVVLVAFFGSALAGALSLSHAGAVLVFVVSGVALAALAALVGDATEQLGTRFGPGATGVLQSALGNLPELFIGIFSLKAGLVTVLQAALVGSILGNNLLVLGLAFVVGGVRHGTQRFASEPPRLIAALMVLSVSALAVPTLASGLHEPAGAHAEALSVVVAIVLLVVFALSVPVSLSGGPTGVSAEQSAEGAWPLWLAIALLCLAGVGAAFVSDWFVQALTPAIEALHLSEAFTGLVIVAIAGNAVENVVGIQLAARNHADYAVSVILNSPLQVALALIPALVLLSFVIGGAHLTLVMPPLLLAALGLSTLIATLVTVDGESVWLEGAALVGLYCIIAAGFWWG